MEGMTDVEWLVAIQQIKQLHAQRDRLLDTGQWDEYEALHVPEHRTVAVGVPSVETAAEAVANVRKIAEHVTFAHQSQTPEITIESPTTARGIWGMSVVSKWKQGDEDHWFLGCGHYFETYEKREGEWKFTSREEKMFFTAQSPGSTLVVD
jgi:hypothetical protein